MEAQTRQDPFSRAWHIARNEGWWSLIDYLVPRWLPTVHARIPSGFGSMEDILKWLEVHNQYEVYSFDIFDTLLSRRIDPPELIKRLTAGYVSTRLAQHGIHIAPDEILAQRSSCEQLLLQLALSRDRDPDYCLDEVMTETLKALKTGSVLDSKETVSHEIGLEKKATQLIPGAIEALSYLRSMGKRIICISDTYLSAIQIALILEYHGLATFIDKLYVSCDLGKRKDTGRLFQHVVENERGRLIHIGDNYISDYAIPRRLGITSLWLHSRSEEMRKGKLRNLRDGNNKLNYVNAVIKRANDGQSALWRIGYKDLGPALTVFVHNVAEQAIKDDVEAMFFLARDGYAMKKIYETIQRTIYVESVLPPAKYMCLGRLPVRLASLRSLDDAHIMDAYAYISKQRGNNVSLKDILGSYGLEPDGFIDIANQYGLDLNEPITNPNQDERLYKLLDSSQLKGIVRRKSAEARELLRNYLAEIGFIGAKKVAVVDANAEGLTQTILDMIFSDDTSYPAVRRYYFNLTTLNVDTVGIKPALSEALGIVADWRIHSPYEQAPFHLFALLIELFCHPNHGVTVGYKKVGGRTVPMFRKTPQEREYPLTSQALQGILAYAWDYCTYHELHNCPGTQLLGDMKSNVVQWVLHPSRTDAASMSGLSLTSDWPVETNYRLIQQVTVWDLATISGLRKKVRSSLWGYATLALAPASRFSTLLYVKLLSA